MRSASRLIVDAPVRSGENWIEATGADGHGRFFLTPRASGCVRPHSYALAIAGGVVAVGCWGSTTVTIRCA